MKPLPLLFLLFLLAGCATPSYVADLDNRLPVAISVEEDLSYDWHPPIGIITITAWLEAGRYEYYKAQGPVRYYKREGEVAIMQGFGDKPEKQAGGVAFNIKTKKVFVWVSDRSIGGTFIMGPIVTYGQSGNEICSFNGFIPPELGNRIHFEY